MIRPHAHRVGEWERCPACQEKARREALWDAAEPLLVMVAALMVVAVVLLW